MSGFYIIIVGSEMKHVNVIAVIKLEIICGAILKRRCAAAGLIVKIL